jgi:hypothetical protein
VPNTVGEFLVHYHEERNHQSLENRIIDPGEEVGRGEGVIDCRERLGGMLRYYRRRPRERLRNCCLQCFCGHGLRTARNLRSRPSETAHTAGPKVPGAAEISCFIQLCITKGLCHG